MVSPRHFRNTTLERVAREEHSREDERYPRERGKKLTKFHPVRRNKDRGEDFRTIEASDHDSVALELVCLVDPFTPKFKKYILPTFFK